MEKAGLYAEVKVQPGCEDCQRVCITCWDEGVLSSLYDVCIEDEAIYSSDGNCEIQDLNEQN